MSGCGSSGNSETGGSSTISDVDTDHGENLHGRTRHPTGHSMTSLQKISVAITGSMEKFFYRWGVMVATHPIKAILCCILITVISGLGVLNFHMENRPDRLWIPRHSEFAKNTEWLRKTFPTPIRTSWAIISADNVLVPEVLRAVVEIHDKVRQIEVSGGKRWNDLCFKLPITKFFSSNRKRRSAVHTNNTDNNNAVPTTTVPKTLFSDESLRNFETTFDDDFFTQDEVPQVPQTEDGRDPGFSPMFNVPDEFYCSMMKELDEACWEMSPAELWSFNKSEIEHLSQADIVYAINHVHISPVFGRKVNYTMELGGEIRRNEKGEIIGAESMMLRWSVRINQTLLDNGQITDQTGEIVDEDCLEWEEKWIQLMKNSSKDFPKGINLYFVNSLSWMEISEATIMEDSMTLALGFAIMFFYVAIMLGKFNMVEQRPFLAVAGLSCVILACIVSYGLCSVVSIPYGPVNKILPFLLLGIGIDDMFVIVQCWNNLFPSPLTVKSNLEIPERVGMALKHAGVSITITSLTDIAAFAVGASTILPGLQSFCIYAAVGIVAVFIFQATYFVAWFSLDQKRVEKRGNAFLCCLNYQENGFIPSKWSQDSYSQLFFEKIISKYLFKPWSKIAVITVTCSVLGVTIYGNTKLRQEFDPMWFLPEDSYMTQYMQTRDHMYPGVGYPGFLVANQVNWSQSFNEFDKLLTELKDSNAIYKFEDWYEDFKEYSNTEFGTNIPNRTLTPSKFQKYMGKFLYSPSGSKYRAYFKVEGNFSCGDTLPPVNAVVMPFRFKKFDGPEEHIPALRYVKRVMKDANMSFTGHSEPKFFTWGAGQVSWEADEIIDAELYRNVVLSLLSVLITTFFLLANFRVCFFCGLCVIFTLINVGGFMYFWGLTIDTVSCVNIVLGIGLCVDYAAHIALAFMTCTGTKEARAKQALRNIGPAVINGGFSTFLAIVLLANSKSHAFLSFFKIFTVVIVSGLYHGLIFLPVILSIFGPDPYPFAYGREDEFDSFKKVPKVVEMKPLQETLDLNKRPEDQSMPSGKFSINDPLLVEGRDEDQKEKTQH